MSVADDGSNGLDANPENNLGTDVDTVIAAPDLGIAKTAWLDMVSVGDILSYTITVDNVGTRGASGITISDLLPANTGFISASDGGAESSPGTVTWPTFGLDSGARATRTLTVNIRRSGSPTETITNTVTVADDNTNGPDPTLENNTAIATTVTKPSFVYLPLVLRQYAIGPDLVVDSIGVVNGALEIVIKNQGQKPVELGLGFWVDLYINPHTVPTQVNQTWPMVATYGAAWGVGGGALPINPGQTRTLRLFDPYYVPAYSTLPAQLIPGDVLYVQVDSVNSMTTYGSVLENHELAGIAYNNISQSVMTDTLTISSSMALTNIAPPLQLLPERR